MSPNHHFLVDFFAFPSLHPLLYFTLMADSEIGRHQLGDFQSDEVIVARISKDTGCISGGPLDSVGFVADHVDGILAEDIYGEL